MSVNGAQLQKLLNLLNDQANYTKERPAQLVTLDINPDPSQNGAARLISNPLFIPTGIDGFRVIITDSTTGDQVAGTLYYAPGEAISPTSKDFETLSDQDSRTFLFRQAGNLFWWPAQTGIRIRIIFYVGIAPQNGTFGVTLLNNSVTVIGGSSADGGALGAAFNQSSITVSGTTTLIGQDTTRKSVTFQVTGGDIVISPSAPAAGGPGIAIASGSTFVWENTAALLAIDTSGVPVVTGIVES